MDQEKRIKAMSKELLVVRSKMDELGPIVLGTISRSTKKYRTKDGKEHVCADSAMLKFSGAGEGSTVRIPKESEKSVRKMIENGKKWRTLNKRWVLLTSRLAVYGALKKTVRDADSEVRESSGNPAGGKRHRVRRGRRGGGGAAGRRIAARPH